MKIFSLRGKVNGVTYLMPGESLDDAIMRLQQYKPGEYNYTGESRELDIDLSKFDGKPIAMLTANMMVFPRPFVELGMENCQIY